MKAGHVVHSLVVFSVPLKVPEYEIDPSLRTVALCGSRTFTPRIL